MMQGTVMKITDRCIVVLCEDGTFRNLPHPPVLPSLGENMSIPHLSEPRQRHSYRRYLKKQWLYAASLVLLLGVVFIFNYMLGSKQPATLVAIDINPGIELVVNQQGLIDEVNLLNEEAEQLLSGKELVNQDFYQAVQWLLAHAEEHGYLDAETEKKWIWLSIVDLGPGAYSIDPAQISVQDKGYHVEIFKVDEQQLEQAKAAELTLNKYIVLELAAEKGIELNPEQLRNQSILNSLHQAGVDPVDLFAEPLQQSGKDESSNESWESDLSKTERNNYNNGMDSGLPDGRNEKESFATSEEEQREAEQRAREAVASQPAEQIEEQVARRDNEDPIKESQAGQEKAGDLVDNSSARGSSGTELPMQKPNDSSIAKVQDQAAADQTENTPKPNSKPEIHKLMLQVKLADDGEIKVEYKNKDGKIEAKVERKSKQKEEKQQGQQAVVFAENVIKHLNVQEKSERKIVVSRVISSLSIKQNEWHEIGFEVEFSNGSVHEFESVNPLIAEDKAQAKKKDQEQKELEKKAEQAKKDQEKANKKAQEIEKEKEKEKALEKAKEKEAEQKKEQAKKAKKAKKKNKDENDDDNDEDN